MWTGPVGAKLMENFSQGSIWHRNLQEMVEEGNLIQQQLAYQIRRVFMIVCIDHTMLSFAPLSPLKYRGWLSWMPSYTTPLGNMDWLVIPKIKTRKDK